MVECKESEMRSEDPIAYLPKLGSVVGSVIQAKWRLSFEDDLRWNTRSKPELGPSK